MNSHLRKILFLVGTLFLILTTTTHAAYRSENLGHGLHAAIAVAGSAATSNAFFVVGNDYVVAGGAHMTKEAIAALLVTIKQVTPKPLRYFILPHHHQGYTHIDFDFPAGVDIIATWQTRDALESEARKPEYPIFFFSEGLTLDLGSTTMIITEVGPGHSEGDLLVFMPESNTLYAGDLVYVDSVGYLGEGYMREWIGALEFIEQLSVAKIIPGYGPVSGTETVTAFKKYFKNFLSEILLAMEQGKTLSEIRQDFALPRYRRLQGYDRFMPVNLKRAYYQLKETLVD